MNHACAVCRRSQRVSSPGFSTAHAAVFFFVWYVTPRLAGTAAAVALTPHACQLQGKQLKKRGVVLGAAPLSLLCCFLGGFRCPSRSAAGPPLGFVPFFLQPLSVCLVYPGVEERLFPLLLQPLLFQQLVLPFGPLFWHVVA